MHKKLSKIKSTISTITILSFLFVSSGASFAEENLDKRTLEKQVKEYQKTGYSYYKKKIYEEAISEYEKALILDPQNKKTKYLIKSAEKRMEKERIRQANIKKTKERKEAKALIDKGKYYYKRKMYYEAIAEFEKALLLDPDNKTARSLNDKARKKIGKEPHVIFEERKIPDKKRPLSLEECITIAMANHTPLKIAEKQLKLAKFRLLEAQRKLGPTATLKWERQRGQVDAKYYEGEKLTVEGKQPVFYGGELVFSVQQTAVNVEIVKNDYDRIKNELVLQVKKAYYSFDKAKKALKIQKELGEEAEKLYVIAKSAYEADLIAQIQFLRVSSQRNQTQFQAISAEEDLSVANLLLQQAMNIDEEIDVIEPKKPNIIELDLDKCFDLAYLNRPELKISKLSLEYFEFEKKIMSARSNWPRVDILASFGQAVEGFVAEDRAPGETDKEFHPEWYFGAKFSVPVWGSTLGYSVTKEEWAPVVRTKQETESVTQSLTAAILDKLEDISGAKEADLEYLRSVEELNKKRQEVTLEVKETFFKYRKAILLMDIAKDKLAFQLKQLEIVKVRMDLGEAQYSDVIEELIKLAEEKFSFIQSITDYYIAIATLNKAVGIDDYFKV